jgi:hypothetical protein
VKWFVLFIFILVNCLLLSQKKKNGGFEVQRDVNEYLSSVVDTE